MYTLGVDENLQQNFGAKMAFNENANIFSISNIPFFYSLVEDKLNPKSSNFWENSFYTSPQKKWQGISSDICIPKNMLKHHINSLCCKDVENWLMDISQGAEFNSQRVDSLRCNKQVKTWHLMYKDNSTLGAISF